MDSPVKAVGTLDYLDQFGIVFEGLIPTPEGPALGLRCTICGHAWVVFRASSEFPKNATECPKSHTSKKHTSKSPGKKAGP